MCVSDSPSGKGFPAKSISLTAEVASQIESIAISRNSKKKTNGETLNILDYRL